MVIKFMPIYKLNMNVNMILLTVMLCIPLKAFYIKGTGGVFNINFTLSEKDADATTLDRFHNECEEDTFTFSHTENNFYIVCEVKDSDNISLRVDLVNAVFNFEFFKKDNTPLNSPSLNIYLTENIDQLILKVINKELKPNVIVTCGIDSPSAPIASTLKIHLLDGDMEATEGTFGKASDEGREITLMASADFGTNVVMCTETPDENYNKIWEYLQIDQTKAFTGSIDQTAENFNIVLLSTAQIQERLVI